MKQEIQNVKNEAIAQITTAKSVKELESLKIAYLGRKGKINRLTKRLSELNEQEKKQAGILLNETKNVISNSIARKNIELTKRGVSFKEWYDISVPGNPPEAGRLHPLTTMLTEIIDVFNYLGYQLTDGPEIETDYYNFEALNIPKGHPARDTQQTLYLETKDTKTKFGEAILRTQTSAMQGRVMEKTKPPLRVLVPGRNFRYEQIDASHGFEFWQVEGFVVDKNIRLTDLFGTIEFVLKRLFGDKSEIVFDTTNFPFVEPGVDTYLKCTICTGKGCPFCKNTGWSEIMPAGMIHPNVLKMAKINPNKWCGFAFAIGLSRVVNLKYQISDLRTLITPDLRIINQF